LSLLPRVPVLIHSNRQYHETSITGQGGKPPTAPELGAAPEIPPAKKVPDDVSNYVDFLHPWGGHGVNLGILVTMFFFFLIGTVLVLRVQDV
jgi:hypothetical protein